MKALRTIFSRFTKLAAILALAAAPFAPSAFAGPYDVRDVVADATGADAAAAQAAAWAQARVTAANRLIERLTLPEDRAGAGGLNIDTTMARNLALSIQTQESEKRTATRYLATLIVKFNGKAVRDYLDSRHIPFVESQAAKGLLSPVAGQGVVPAAWAAAWAGKSGEDSLTPYVASTAPVLDRKRSLEELRGEMDGVGATRAISAEAYAQAGQIYVRITETRPGAPETALAVAGPFASLDAAQRGAIDAMEVTWKRASIVRGGGTTTVNAVARFSTLAQWVAIRKAAETSRMITALNIEAVSPKGADLSFSFSGRPDQLVADFRSKGVNLSAGDANGWLVEAAPTQ